MEPKQLSAVLNCSVGAYAQEDGDEEQRWTGGARGKYHAAKGQETEEKLGWRTKIYRNKWNGRTVTAWNEEELKNRALMNRYAADSCIRSFWARDRQFFLFLRAKRERSLKVPCKCKNVSKDYNSKQSCMVEFCKLGESAFQKIILLFRGNF